MNKKVKRVLMTLILVFLGLLFWLITLLMSNLSSWFSKTEIVPEVLTSTENHDTQKKRPKHTSVDISQSGKLPEIESQGESIEVTIARLKRDVIVTGTISGISGQESAIFQIEGMADRQFNINTQLMDGFIIVEITHSTVILKNQIGHETFSLTVQSEAKPEGD